MEDCEADGNETEGLDWLSEGTYCSVNSTPMAKPSSSGNSNANNLSASSNGVLAVQQKAGAHEHNQSSLIVKHGKDSTETTPQESLTCIEKPRKESSSNNLKIDVSKYLTVPQRIVRLRNSGLKQVIRVLVPRDFLKKQDKPCAVFACPRCNEVCTDLQKLDDHMISLHDVDSNSTSEDCTSNVIVVEPSEANLVTQFSCSVCNRVQDSMLEWQRHIYMHMISRTKRFESNKVLELSDNDVSEIAAETLADESNEVANGISEREIDSIDLSATTESLIDSYGNHQPIKRKRGRKRLAENVSVDGSYEKKFMACKLCKRFTYSKQGELKRHMLNDHGDQLHKCKHCEMAFPLGFELLRHIRLYHPGQPVKKNPPARKAAATSKLRIRLTEKSSDVIKVEISDDDYDKACSVKASGAKKRRLASDSEDDDELIAEDAAVVGDNAGEVSQGNTAKSAKRLRHCKSSKPIKITVAAPKSKSEQKAPNKRKSNAVKRPVISDDDTSSSEESEKENDDDPIWDFTGGKNKSNSTRKQPARMSRRNGKREKSDTELEASKKIKCREYKGFQPTSCDHCGGSFSKRKELVSHIMSEHSDKLLQCPSCPKSFALANSLKIHILGCHSMQMFTCRRCDMKFLTLSRLQRHIRVDHLNRPAKVGKVKLYGCTYCGKMFQTKQILDGHTNQHHLNLRPYKCSKCGIDFAYVNNFKMHERNCLKSMICELCGENFSTKSLLADHQKTVHDTVLDTADDMNKPEFPCSHCNRDFPDELSLKCHMARVGSAAARPSVLCDICGKECKKAAGLTMHKAYCHPNEVSASAADGEDASEDFRATSDTASGPKKNDNSLADSFTVAATPVNCPDCGKVCQTATSLRIHRTRMHAGSGPRRVSRSTQHTEVKMTCPSCGLECKGKVGLAAHLRTQHAEPTLAEVRCDKCDRTFSNKLGLDAHKRHAHTDTRKYRQAMPCSCPICSKEFPREGNLKLHMTVVHGLSAATKKKPSIDKVFDCPICSHQFKKKAYLQRHLRVHGGTKPYICTVCSKCFTSSTNLSGHMAALHKDVEYTYNPLVNMVCNVAADTMLPPASQSVPPGHTSIMHKAPGVSRKTSKARKNPPAATVTMDTVGSLPPLEPIVPVAREEAIGYSQQDVLNMSRDMQLAPRNMSANMVREMPVMSREIPGMMMREVPVMTTTREFPNMSHIQNMASRDMANMPRDMSNVPRDLSGMPREFIMPRENPNVPQYAIGSMPANWNYAYMSEFYRL